MATSIHGKRALHSHRAKKPTDKDTEEIAEWQNPGDIYLSSPASFMHSVEYPENPSWDTRVIAIQARFLITQRDFTVLRGTRFQGGTPWKMLLGVISLCLSEVTFKVPTLEQVKKMEEEIKKQNEKDKEDETTTKTEE